MSSASRRPDLDSLLDWSKRGGPFPSGATVTATPPLQTAARIPVELWERPQWVAWKLVQRPGRKKPDKLPVNPRTGEIASSTNPDTWADYNTAAAGVERYSLAGVGFVFTEGDPFAGADLDGCRNPQTGEIQGWAQEIIAALDSYTEVSPSGTGVKLFLKGKLPADAKHNVAYHGGRVEMYHSGRYFTVTGQHVPGTPSTIEDRQTELTTVYADVFGKIESAAAAGAEAGECISKGRRHHVLAALIGKLIREHVPQEGIMQSALALNKTFCPALDESEVAKTVADMALRYASPAPSTTAHAAGTPWPDPLPLGGELPAVQAFDLALLPEALRDLVEDTAERMQVPLDYPAVVAILSLAGATNRRATIQPKAIDTSWVVVPNLWGGIVGPPGLMKSPIITVITHPLTQIEAEWRAQYKSAVSECKQQMEKAELRHAAWREQYKAAQKTGKTGTDEPVRPDDHITVPIPHRLITQDATAEKLHELLGDNPAGVMMIRDELSGWLATLDKPGREGERGFFLSAWNGDTPYTMDRIGRGSIYVEACCVSMLGGIQPARLRSYLVDALIDGPQNDGLFQRFQVLVYPDIPKNWHYVDRSPNSTAIEGAERLYRRLTKLEVADPFIKYHIIY